MVAMTSLGRFLERANLALHRWARLEGIPTEKFNDILKAHLSSGWQKTYVYEGFDAWIDYGRVDLRRGRERLRFEWTNWLEGEISGPPTIVRSVADAHGLAPDVMMTGLPNRPLQLTDAVGRCAPSPTRS
jgi:hypothetical protein